MWAAIESTSTVLVAEAQQWLSQARGPHSIGVLSSEMLQNSRGFAPMITRELLGAIRGQRIHAR